MSLHRVMEHALTVYYDGNRELTQKLLTRREAEIRAEVLREAADAINALPQDFECDPGRGDSAELLRRMADEVTP